MARPRAGHLGLGFVQMHVQVRADFVRQRLHRFQRL